MNEVSILHFGWFACTRIHHVNDCVQCQHWIDLRVQTPSHMYVQYTATATATATATVTATVTATATAATTATATATATTTTADDSCSFC